MSLYYIVPSAVGQGKRIGYVVKAGVFPLHESAGMLA